MTATANEPARARAGRVAAWIGVVALAAAALRRWGLQLGILVGGEPEWAALDLRQRVLETRAWFAGEEVYRRFDEAVYPPASYALFQPLLGWLDDGPLRLVWALLLLGSTAALSVLALRVARPASRPAGWLLALLPWGHYASAAGVGVGQVTLPCLAALGWSLYLVLERGAGEGAADGASGEPSAGGRPARGIAAGVLYALSLLKPTLSGLFCWHLLAPRHRLLPAAVAGGVYGGLTLVAAAHQPVGFGELLVQWTRQLPGIPEQAGYGYLRGLVPAVGAAAVAAILAAVFALRRRRAAGRRPFRRSPAETIAAAWLLAGLTALASRVLVYHLAPSDLLVLFPVLGLLRAAKAFGSPGRRRLAWALAGAVAGAGLLPMSWYLAGGALRALFFGVQLALWALLAAVSLAWLAGLVGRQRPAAGSAR